MINEFGIRLHSARKMAGMSMDALALKAGAVVSKQAISKYEKGLINPGSEVLLALAGALNVKADYFFRSSKIAMPGWSLERNLNSAKKLRGRLNIRRLIFFRNIWSWRAFLILNLVLTIPYQII